MIEYLISPDKPSFTFGEAVLLANASPKQLRNFMDGSRGILDVGKKHRLGRWLFSAHDALLILVVSELNSIAHVAPQAAAEIARSVVPLLSEALAGYTGRATGENGNTYWEALCGYPTRDGDLAVFGRATDDKDGGLWRDMATGRTWRSLRGESDPAIGGRPHILLPIDEMVEGFVRRVKALSESEHAS